MKKSNLMPFFVIWQFKWFILQLFSIIVEGGIIWTNLSGGLDYKEFAYCILICFIINIPLSIISLFYFEFHDNYLIKIMPLRFYNPNGLKILYSQIHEVLYRGPFGANSEPIIIIKYQNEK